MADPKILDTNSLVTVVIPTRFRPDFVCKAVSSALGQTYDNIEVLVVIDGPDPETENALATIPDPRLRVIALKENVGGSEARNTGVREGRGKWVAFLDDDDEWLPTKVAKQKAAWEASPYPHPIIFSSIIGRTPSKEFVWPRRFPKPDDNVSEYLFCRKNPAFGDTALQTSTFFAARQLFLDVPFLKGLKKHQDWDWLLRVGEQPGIGLIVIQEPLAVFRIGGQRQSVGRSADWKHSVEWAIANRSRMTGRAFSFFIAIECVAQASRSKADLRSYLRLFREHCFRGRPTFYSSLLFFMYWLIPQERRQKIAGLLHKWRLKFSRTARSQAEFANS